MIRKCKTRDGNEEFIQKFGQRTSTYRIPLRGRTHRQEKNNEMDMKAVVCEDV